MWQKNIVNCNEDDVIHVFSIQFQVDESLIYNNIFPNPTSDFINIDYHSKNNQNINIAIINSNGKLLKQWDQVFTEGQHQLTIDVEDFIPNNYFLILTSKFKTHHLPFTIINN